MDELARQDAPKNDAQVQHDVQVQQSVQAQHELQVRPKKGGFDFASLAIFLFIAITLLSNALNFYQMYHSPRCPEGAQPVQCYSPLFKDGELVDLYIYLTTDPKLPWWTSKGIEALHHVPLWNATAIRYGSSIPPEAVRVPLSEEALHSVRRNESALRAHCFLVRGGLSLKNILLGANLRRAPQRSLVTSDLMHTQSVLTQVLPRVIQERRNLLGDSAVVQTNGSTPDDNSTNLPREAPPEVVSLPLVGWRLPVYPGDALCWAVSAFCATAFFSPSAGITLVRQGLAVGAVPWLYHLRGVQQEKWREVKRKRRRENEAMAAMLESRRPVVPHLVPIIRLNMAIDLETYDARAPPPLLYKEFIFHKGSPMPAEEREVRYEMAERKSRREMHLYAPPFFFNKFGIQKRYWRPLDANISHPDPDIQMEVNTEGMIRYSVMETIKQMLEMYIKMGFTERDLEDVQDVFFRHPLHILVIMQVISFIQMTLTTLAFKNDISFFRGRTDYSGLSSRSLGTDTLQDIVIFLYLYDFDDISRILLGQTFISSMISAWKYVCVARLRIFWSSFLPWVSHNRDDAQDERNTEEIDAKGMRYLKFVLYPLSAAWGMYNLCNYNYKSWWSWLVSSMADFAYTFGFINMTPQIFINYKLKSVAHMPWRVLMYKFFNTFIDDVFAWFIMSEYVTKKHRIMTLRDDIVFFIFLYQRYIYKVDHKRPDEFGFVYAEEHHEEPASVEDEVPKLNATTPKRDFDFKDPPASPASELKDTHAEAEAAKVEEPGWHFCGQATESSEVG